MDSSTLYDLFSKDSLSSMNAYSTTLGQMTNEELNYKFKNLKSSNLQFLSSDKNARVLGKLGPGKTSIQFDDSSNAFASLGKEIANKTASNPQLELFKSSQAAFMTESFKSRVLTANKTLSPSHPPVNATNPQVSSYSFDKYTEGKPTESPLMLRSKEEVAPTFLFSTY